MAASFLPFSRKGFQIFSPPCESTFISRLLKSEKGSLVFVMAVAVFGLITALSMTTLAYQDTINLLHDREALQEIHLIRSEMERGILQIALKKGLWDTLPMPEKYITIRQSGSTHTYIMKTLLAREDGSTYSTGYFRNGFKISVMAKVKRGRYYPSVWGGEVSPVKKYAEMHVSPHKSVNQFAFYTHTDTYPNGNPHVYWGSDVVYGKVHSNSDIWIGQGGGGNNNGWPTFYGTVSTTGQIQSMSGTPPYTSIFRGGYWEHQESLPIEVNIRATSIAVGGSDYNPNRIVYVTVYGSSYSSFVALIVNSGPDTADVWTQYPPRSGNYLFRNRYTKFDTIWNDGPQGNSYSQACMVYSKLWLKGNFTGPQTWCAADTVYLNDNCTLFNTPLGQNPDGDENGNMINRRDILGIVSEKSVVIQYGYRDPADSLRKRPNCDGDGTNTGGGAIWIYAAICALGQGATPQQDGMFTFQYQHPHPSTPDVRLNGNPYIWSKIDIHRNRYPQSASSPWSAFLDYPWYNPLWPESSPLMERGTVHLRGSIAQRRQGYIHRNLYDPDYPNPNGIWNIPLDMCGGPAGNSVTDKTLSFTMQPVNAPNATGSGVGYRYKDYRYDTRFEYMSPPNFPVVRNMVSEAELSGIIFRPPPKVF